MSDRAAEMQKSAMIGIEYDEFHPDTYKRVDVTIDHHVTPFTGHFFGAYRRAVDFAHANADEVIELSSVDNFAQDLDPAAIDEGKE